MHTSRMYAVALRLHTHPLDRSFGYGDWILPCDDALKRLFPTLALSELARPTTVRKSPWYRYSPQRDLLHGNAGKRGLLSLLTLAAKQ